MSRQLVCLALTTSDENGGNSARERQEIRRHITNPVRFLGPHRLLGSLFLASWFGSSNAKEGKIASGSRHFMVNKVFMVN